MKINQEDVHIIARNSDWNEEDISLILKSKVYNSKESWLKFLELFFLSLGVTFVVAGILFFFAYNWSDLHKFIKIGIVEVLIISLVLVTVYSKIQELFKNVLLTGSTMLVGVLFAVFGQIYQTGANAYDFFLGWTMAVSLWVFVSNFSPLWLMFVALVNLTSALYLDQVHLEASEILISSLFIFGNFSFLFTTLYLKKRGNNIPNWLTYLLALFIGTILTITLVLSIFEEGEQDSILILVIALFLYPLGFYYGIREKQSFYLAIVSFSLTVVIASVLIHSLRFNDFSILLFIGLFTVVSITLVIKMLMIFQNKWKDGE